MNSNEYNILKCMYESKKALFFREIAKVTKTSIGGTQQVLKKYSEFIDKMDEGKNTYYWWLWQ